MEQHRGADLLTDIVIVSDDAGQFQLGQHGLCWVHAERLVHKPDTFTDAHRAAQQWMRGLIWWFYRDLKAYRRDPAPRRSAVLRGRFDRIFKRRTGFGTIHLAWFMENETGILSGSIFGPGETSYQRVGRDEDVIREYIQDQEQEDKRLKRLNLWR